MTSIAPWLSVKNATEALASYRAAFGATELERLEDEAGDVIVAQLSIEGADFWIQADAASSPEAVNGRSVRMILTVDDPDSVFAGAVAAGAVAAGAVAAGANEVAAVAEGHGWRTGRVADPSGHHWEIGRRLAT